MRNIFNYTDRKDDIRKTGDNPEIKIDVIEKDGVTEYEPQIKIDLNRKLPKDSRVLIQAYSNSGFVGIPIEYGTVGSPKIIKTKETDVGKDEIKFRLKIVSDDKSKKILASCYKIEPWGSVTWLKVGKRDQDSLIEYVIEPNEIPILYFKKGFGLERDLEQSSYLKNIHYSYAVREVLQTYIIKAETFSDCKVRDVWIEKFQSLTKEDLPEKLDEDGKDWLDKAVAAFLDEKQQGLNGKSLIDLMPDSSMILSEKLTFKGK